MKYTTEEALTEILRRREQLVSQRNRHTLRVLSGAASIILSALMVAITLLPNGVSSAPAGTVYGSFLLSAEAGGYVLAAVIAFVLGVCVTLLSLRYRRRKTNHKEECHTDE